MKFKSAVSDKWFTGSIIRALKDGFYLVDDGKGLTPRRVHENNLGLVIPPAGEVFA